MSAKSLIKARRRWTAAPTGHVRASWRRCQASCEGGVTADVTPAYSESPSHPSAEVVGWWWGGQGWAGRPRWAGRSMRKLAWRRPPSRLAPRPRRERGEPMPGLVTALATYSATPRPAREAACASATPARLLFLRAVQ